MRQILRPLVYSDLTRSHWRYHFIKARMMKLPQDIRDENRKNLKFKTPSNVELGVSPYLQANVAVLPSEYAKDFEIFCQQNKAPCPILYISKPGECGAPLLAKDSDIRTDLAAYKVFRNGSFDSIAKDLLDFNWDDMVTFYLGCSFTFEAALMASGIPVTYVQEKKRVPMYITNIQCHTSGPFSSAMVVSMRYIDESSLDKVLDTCRQCDYCHGAPIHIGNGEEIGITADSVNYGDSVVPKPGEIPVFWACGVTSSFAIAAARLPLVFSHYPGCMFVADIDKEQTAQLLSATLYPVSKAICLDKQKQSFSVLSKNVIDIVSRLEEVAIDDPGNRGVKPFLVSNDLLKATLSLSQNGKNVCIVTGFPCFDDEPHEETDGIAGAVAIARALQALSKSVTLLVDGHASSLFHSIMEWCHQQDILKHEVPVISMNKSLTIKQSLFDDVTEEPRYSHLIAIERPGKNKVGHYCTIKGRTIAALCDPIDDIFVEALHHDDIVTIGIGDGGNEIGMGKVVDIVSQIYPDIACSVATDYLITAGVSNWGGYALAAALYAVSTCPVHERYRRRGIGTEFSANLDAFLTSKEQEISLQKYLMSKGVRDGITRTCEMMVDGLDFDQYHVKKVEAIHDICS